MKIVAVTNLNNKINDSNVRWYLSSQEIWIGQEENYQEIEVSVGKSYGSFSWLYSGADTILFDKKKLEFKSSVIKVNEPISIIEGKTEFVNSREGTIKLVEGRYFEYNASDCSKYYIDEDILVAYKEMIKIDNQTFAINLSRDFSFIIKNDELVGWILKNASRHLAGDDINCVDVSVRPTKFIISKLVKYLRLIERLNMELTIKEEEKLIGDFKALYDEIKTSTLTPSIAIKESIANIINFM